MDRTSKCDLGSLPVIAHRAIKDEVYDLLRERILSRQLAPGQRIDPADLERQMGVSRTPLKDALNRLALERLVVIEPRRGTFVSRLTPEEVSEAFDVRRVLEAYAVELAAARISQGQLEELERIVSDLRALALVPDWTEIYLRYVDLDYSFHRLIVGSTGNERLLETWEQVNLHVMMARVRYRRTERELDVSQREHETILSLLKDRDRASLGQVMSQHIERAKNSLLDDMTEYLSAAS